MLKDVFAGLSDEQRRAVETLHGPVCILAGAGAGKTTTITRRIAQQVRSGEFAAQNILAVTFTTKAAAELAARLEGLGAPGVPAKTFHAAALSQLTVLGGRNFDLLPSKIRIVKDAARGLPAQYRKIPLPDLAAEIERAKNQRVTPERYAAALGETGPLPAGELADDGTCPDCPVAELETADGWSSVAQLCEQTLLAERSSLVE